MSCRRIIVACAASCLLMLAACQSRPPVETDDPGTAPQPEATMVEHAVREGESLALVADLYYGDPARAIAIARDNEISADADLMPGSVLYLKFADDELDSARRRQAALRPYNRGVAAMGQGDLNEAERQFRLALTTEKGLDVARYNLALVLLKRGRYEEATGQLAPLVERRPDDPDYGFALGNALFYQTRYDEAAAAYEVVLAGDPTHRRAAFGKARALQEGGLLDAAKAAWDRYLELDDRSPWADEARRLRRQIQDR